MHFCFHDNQKKRNDFQYSIKTIVPKILTPLYEKERGGGEFEIQTSQLRLVREEVIHGFSL